MLKSLIKLIAKIVLCVLVFLLADLVTKGQLLTFDDNMSFVGYAVLILIVYGCHKVVELASDMLPGKAGGLGDGDAEDPYDKALALCDSFSSNQMLWIPNGYETEAFLLTLDRKVFSKQLKVKERIGSGIELLTAHIGNQKFDLSLSLEELDSDAELALNTKQAEKNSELGDCYSLTTPAGDVTVWRVVPKKKKDCMVHFTHQVSEGLYFFGNLQIAKEYAELADEIVIAVFQNIEKISLNGSC